MAITPKAKHDHCDTWVILHPNKMHYASLVCKQHNAWIQWLNYRDCQFILSQGLSEIRPKHTGKILTADELGL